MERLSMKPPMHYGHTVNSNLLNRGGEDDLALNLRSREGRQSKKKREKEWKKIQAQKYLEAVCKKKEGNTVTRDFFDKFES